MVELRPPIRNYPCVKVTYWRHNSCILNALFLWNYFFEKYQLDGCHIEWYTRHVHSSAEANLHIILSKILILQHETPKHTRRIASFLSHLPLCYCWIDFHIQDLVVPSDSNYQQCAFSSSFIHILQKVHSTMFFNCPYITPLLLKTVTCPIHYWSTQHSVMTWKYECFASNEN